VLILLYFVWKTINLKNSKEASNYVDNLYMLSFDIERRSITKYR